MEKFSKFDDPSCGLNPFIPLEKTQIKPMSSTQVMCRNLCKVFLVVLRLPCIGMAIFMWLILHIWKYLLLIPYLTRLAERFNDKLIAQLLMNVTSFNNVKEQYHRQDDGFDFAKWQKGELTVTKLAGDVIICNQTCFIDWIYLVLNYSPIFTKIVIQRVQGNKKVGLRALGYFETVFHALGIKFPEVIESNSGSVYYSIKEIQENNGLICKQKNAPVVIMPEGTKTNGLGILDIEKDIIKMIDDAAGPDTNLKVHALRFDHQFKYFSAYNTTDSFGFINFIACISQFTSKYIVQFYFNINAPLRDCKSIEDKSDFVKACLMIRTKEQSLKSLSWREHQEFIKLWNQTKDKKAYTV